jgi:hypothetical protein
MIQNKPLNLNLVLKAGSILFVITLLAFAGCSSTHKSAGKKLTTEDLTLTYIDKAQAGGEIERLTLQHPLPISEQQMQFHMAALSYENLSLLGKAGPVFSKEDIQKTLRLLTKAINKAHPQNIIGFEVKSEDGATKGELFATHGNLHWRFFEIQGVKYSLTRNQMARYGTAWKMVPKKGQRLYVTDKFMGAKQWTNWIEAIIVQSIPSNLETARPKKGSTNNGSVSPLPPPSSSDALKAAPKKDVADLEEKLRFLKHLRENQLIDQQEYEQKRKDLLDQYL